MSELRRFLHDSKLDDDKESVATGKESVVFIVIC